MDNFRTVLRDRDGLNDADVEEEFNHARNEFYNIIEGGGSYDDVEEFLIDNYGLEMDYIFDLL